MAHEEHFVIVRPMRVFFAAFLLIFGDPANIHSAQSQAGHVAYELRYAGTDDPRVSLRITPEIPLAAPVTFVTPRTYPGGYAFVPYDDFIEDVYAFSPD